jgi:Transposase DDE domain
MDDVTAEHGLNVLIPPDSSRRKEPHPAGTTGRPKFMRHLLDSPVGSQFYRQRKQTVEPVFAHTKHNRHIHRFHRRGRSAVRTEWRLILMTHNLTKLQRHLNPATG